MLIQSNFKDYYDSAISMGIDKSVLYKRITSKIQLKDGFFVDGLPQYFPDDLDESNYYSSKKLAGRNYYKWMIIGFCGVYHVAVFNTIEEGETNHTIAYYGKQILELEWQIPKNFWRYDHPKKVAEQVVNQWHLKKEQTFFTQLNTPIFAKQIVHSLSDYEWKNKQLYLEKFEVNPNLNNYQFYKVADVVTTFQQIQSYISGVLGSKENEMIELSNNSKIVKAGFDLKTSFRKSKKN